MHQTFFQLRRAELSAQALKRALLEEYELADRITPVQLDVLLIVYERLSVMVWQLRDLLGVQAPAVSRMVTRLEKKGLVVREKWAPDERMILVRLTRAGEELMAEAMQTVCKPDLAAAHAAFMSASEPKEKDLGELDRLLLSARVSLGDPAKFVNPWQRVALNRGFSLREPPGPEDIHPPRDAQRTERERVRATAGGRTASRRAAPRRGARGRSGALRRCA